MIETDIPDDIIIRRYLTPFKFEYLIKNKSLYMASYSSFSDQLEGGITAADYIRNSNEPDLLSAADDILGRIGDRDGYEERRRRSAELVSELRARKFETIFGQESRDNYEAYLKNARNWLYACCLHTYDYECHAMWEIYGKEKHPYRGSLFDLPEGSGFCIETTVARLKENVLLLEGHKFALSMVDYINHSDASATENPLHQFTRKARHFEFEKEVRLIAWPTSEDIVFSYKFEQSSVNDVGQVSPNIKDMNRFISRIIFSPGMPDDCVEAVTQVCRAQGLICNMDKSALDEKPMLDVYGYLAAYPKP
ncbi:hypothetical protein [Pseudomonas umsongensis]|uniref:DUF2971 domain-containing protein n=1 Tax=Pseudomonas umsongensis TaxID=198618 RepID=A0AAE7DG91_9PSED|nr:hypothetical protein [Pseudomonas umsongensis]QJC81281.1 hypothetical protein HGP31_24325 [Pseudomonas umsongensis]